MYGALRRNRDSGLARLCDCAKLQTELSHAGGFTPSSHSIAEHVIASGRFVISTSS
jgi:hypothetical protein